LTSCEVEQRWVSTRTAELRRFVETAYEPSVVGGELSVGIEHEFFLLERNDELPARHATSQRFLERMHGRAGFSKITTRADTYGEMIESVSCAAPRAFPDTIKYDHHPHLMEIALAPLRDLGLLHARLEEVVETAREVATGLDLLLLQVPFLDVAPSHPRMRSELREFVARRRCRRLLLERQGIVDVDAENFAATIAATQTHIGGWSWLEKPKIVERLYQRERRSRRFSYVCAGISDIPAAYRRRWRDYRRVFRASPLVGLKVPRPWTPSAWYAALLETPLASTCDPQTLVKRLIDTHDAITGELFDQIRDLQNIRPRLFGTVEFRGDPAQPGTREVVALARMRRNQVRAELERPAEPYARANAAGGERTAAADLKVALLAR